MKLYKYTSFNTGMQIIESSKMAITKPSDFNDPFDCLPVYSEEDIKQAQTLINGYILDTAIFSMFKKIHLKITNPFQKALIGFVLKEYDFAVWLYKKLGKNKLIPYKPICSFEKAVHFLELCEKFKKHSDEIANYKKAVIDHYDLILNCESNAFKNYLNLRDSIYVLSLTSKNDSILMWSYYGQDHKGFCFEIEIDDYDSTLEKVEYCKERPTTPLTTLMGDFCGQLLVKKIEPDREGIAIFNDIAFKPYITKSLEWKHEDEYRLVIPKEAFEEIGITSKICSDNKERHMRNMKITKVYLGAAMSEENKNCVREAAGDKIEIVEASISDTDYKLIL